MYDEPRSKSKNRGPALLAPIGAAGGAVLAHRLLPNSVLAMLAGTGLGAAAGGGLGELVTGDDPAAAAFGGAAGLGAGALRGGTVGAKMGLTGGAVLGAIPAIAERDIGPLLRGAGSGAAGGFILNAPLEALRGAARGASDDREGLRGIFQNYRAQKQREESPYYDTAYYVGSDDALGKYAQAAAMPRMPMMPQPAGVPSVAQSPAMPNSSQGAMAGAGQTPSTAISKVSPPIGAQRR